MQNYFFGYLTTKMIYAIIKLSKGKAELVKKLEGFILEYTMEEKIKKAVWDIAGRVRILLPGMNAFDLYAAACLLRVASGEKIVIENIYEVMDQLDNKVRYMISNYSKIGVCWDHIKELALDYETAVFDGILLSELPIILFGNKEKDYIPRSLTRLIFNILQINNGDNVANLHPRSGILLLRAAKAYPFTKLTGIETEDFSARTAYLRNVALNNRIVFEDKKTLADLITAAPKMNKYNKIISTHPFGLRSRFLNNQLAKVQRELAYVKTGTAGDWLYCAAAMRLLEEDGEAVALISSGCLFTAQDREAREHFIKYGYIKTVISLPRKMFEGSNVSLALVILSRKNEKVRLVDASEMYTRGRRRNKLTRDDINHITDACEADGENSVTVDSKLLAENDYNLSPERHLVTSGSIKNGKQLKELVSFSRGIMARASELDEMTAYDEGASNACYLRLSDINDGVVDDVLPKLKYVNEEYEKYRLEDKDIIISRNGAPFKIAIFRKTKAEDRVYPVGNMYILRADSQKIEPYYLKAFLESEQGTECLKKLLTGVAIQVISLEALKRMIVPVPDMEEQKRIANKYLGIMEELESLKLRTKAVKEKLIHVLDEIKDGEADNGSADGRPG